MSMWDKKFKELLEVSAENTELKQRVATLEDQLGKIMLAVSGVQRSCIDLSKITVDNRRGLEEVYAYLTATEEQAQDPMLEDDIVETFDELTERKRMMN